PEPTQQGSASSSAAQAAPTHEAVMAQAPAENFPVASLILPRAQRGQLMAIYGVARLIDDIGDESTGERSANLDWLDAELDRVFSSSPAEHPTTRALQVAMRSRPLPGAPLRALVQANRQAQAVTRYDSFDQLLEDCRLSAAPVGELVLHVFGSATP